MEKLKIYCEDKNCLPTRAHSTDAGLDLRASKRVNLPWNTIVSVGTGIHVEIPKGCVGLVFPRSGLATKQGITLANSVGVIDSDYRGEIICALVYRNPSRISGNFDIMQYTRIAQLIIIPCSLMNPIMVDKLKDLSNTDRGHGGFGSSD